MKFLVFDIWCSMFYTLFITAFGTHIRASREKLRKHDRAFSLRQVAIRIGVEPAYLSKIERGKMSPPSEGKILLLAKELDENPDVLLALAGKVSSDLLDIVRKRPKLFADLLRQLKSEPDNAILHIVREVKDGEW